MPESNTMAADLFRDHVSTAEAEKFVFIVRNGSFDHTKWQREHFDSVKQEQIQKAV